MFNRLIDSFMPKFIISGGGTGGHIFPAVSIAGEILRRDPQAELLFVGAKGGMEETVVPKYGYRIESVPISGIQRQLTAQNIFRNLQFPFKLMRSLAQSRAIIDRFQPDAVVGVGGFASGPLGRAAASQGIPLFLCEQNAYPGLVNRWLAGKARKILLGNADAQSYFDASKTVVTGNPIRSFTLIDRNTAAQQLGLDPAKPILLSLGGSLGALRINQALQQTLHLITEGEVQLVWQCGKRYHERLQAEVPSHPHIKLSAFIDDMALAYAAADLVISRAGGSTISELIALSKPSVLVPSPNVSEDHQTKNALSLSEKQAAVLVKDADAIAHLLPTALAILGDPERLAQLTQRITAFEKHDAAREIVDEIFEALNT
jgi:UDP-N-acetylglucosamine--N-acetylmuramyl-(pentapeptide) pyrophosphoryl-undecaprenol N-acetylglucosamine transferase